MVFALVGGPDCGMGLLRACVTHPSGQDLKKNELQPHLKKTWGIAALTSQFIAQMERRLWLYALPFDPQYPVIGVDERPCFLIGDVIDAQAMQAGRVAREH